MNTERYPVRSTRYVIPPKKKRAAFVRRPKKQQPFHKLMESSVPIPETPWYHSATSFQDLPGTSSNSSQFVTNSTDVMLPWKGSNSQTECYESSHQASRSPSPVGVSKSQEANTDKKIPTKCWLCPMDSVGEKEVYSKIQSIRESWKAELKDVEQAMNDTDDDEVCEEVYVSFSELLGDLFGDVEEEKQRIVENLQAMVVVQGKRPLRVLSLFDGIGTGIFALEQLGLVLSDYYASEIDLDAISISGYNFEGRVHQLGDVTQLDNDKVRSLGKFDILIGGSPCNDLSLVNPDRRGLYNSKSTGFLFFDYVRIKGILSADNPNLFFLFENTAAMPKEIFDDISYYLHCKPRLVDAKYFSPQSRARYFWTNLPVPKGGEVTEHQPGYKHLEMYMTPNCGRKSTVEKIRTLTTNSNCLLQGRNRIPAVMMNDKEDTLWITELEEIFGFPRHFTDVGNLSAKRRRELLGKAWSVPVVAYIFKPLCDLFETRDIPREENLK